MGQVEVTGLTGKHLYSCKVLYIASVVKISPIMLKLWWNVCKWGNEGVVRCDKGDSDY